MLIYNNFKRMTFRLQLMKILIVLLVNLMTFTVVFAETPITIKVGNVIGDAPGGRMPLHTGLLQKQISKNIYKYTNGEIYFEILEGKRPDIPVFVMPDMTAKGDVIQATIVPSLFLSRVPEMLLQSIPFLFESDEHSRRFMNSEIDIWLSDKVEQAYDVKVLGSFHHSNAVSINSITPILKVEDFNGIFLNDFSENWKPLWQNIKPKEISYIGYNDAVNGKLIEYGVKTEVTIGMLQNNHSQRLHERYKHLTLVPNMYNIYYTVLINKDAWHKLSSFQQEGIKKAIKKAQDASIAMHADTMIWAIQLNQSDGVKIHFLSPKERKNWKNEFYPKMLNSVINKSTDPEKTRLMIQKTKELVKDLEWQ